MLVYNLIGNSEFVTINRDSGVLRISKSLADYAEDAMVLRFSVTDGIHYDYHDVTLQIVDENRLGLCHKVHYCSKVTILTDLMVKIEVHFSVMYG